MQLTNKITCCITNCIYLCFFFSSFLDESDYHFIFSFSAKQKAVLCITTYSLYIYLEYVPFYACIIPKLNVFRYDIVNIHISKLLYVFIQSSRHIFNKELNIYILMIDVCLPSREQYIYTWNMFTTMNCTWWKNLALKDTKGVIKSRKSKRYRQYKGKHKKNKRTNNDLQNITQ